MEKFDDPARDPSLIANHRQNLARLGSAQQMSKVVRALSPPESRTSRLLRVVRSIKNWLGSGEPDHRSSARTVPTFARQHNAYSGTNRGTDWAGSSRDSSVFSKPSREKGVIELYRGNQEKSRSSPYDKNYITNINDADGRNGIRRLQDIDRKSTDKTSPEKAQFETRSERPMSAPSPRNGLSVLLPPTYEASEEANATGKNAQSTRVELGPRVAPDRGTAAREELMARERPPSYSR